MRPALARSEDVDKRSFLQGSFFYLLADSLWPWQVGEPTQARFKPQGEADPAFIWQVKRDWYGLDLAFVLRHPESLYWKAFPGAETSGNYLPYLPGRAIAARVQEIKDLYRRTDEEIEARYGRRPGIYLSQAEYDQFIDGNRRRLKEACVMLLAAGASAEGRRVSSSLWRDGGGSAARGAR